MIHQLIYTSRLNPGVSAADLLQISDTASSQNTAHDITGMMLCAGDLIVQILEGPKEQIDSLFDHIRKDLRHTDVRVMAAAKAKSREFEGQGMVLKFVPTGPRQDAFEALISATVSVRRQAA